MVAEMKKEAFIKKMDQIITLMPYLKPDDINWLEYEKAFKADDNADAFKIAFAAFFKLKEIYNGAKFLFPLEENSR